MHAPLFAGSPRTTAQSTTARAKSLFMILLQGHSKCGPISNGATSLKNRAANVTSAYSGASSRKTRFSLVLEQSP